LLAFLNINPNLNYNSFYKTQLDKAEIQPNIKLTKTAPTKEKTIVSITHWFWLVALLILIVERILALYRKQ